MTAIAIDGPAGAGKSTIAREVAKRLDYLYVDTGALYRAIGLYALRAGIDPGDQEALVPLIGRFTLELRHNSQGQQVFLDGQDVSEAIRAPEVGMAASKVSAMPEVREFLLQLQRDFAKRGNVVMDGRDIGTVVLPSADIKIFLTASLEERARRRYREHLAKGMEVQYNNILKEMEQRDDQDRNRAVSPLKEADDAVLVDTSKLDLQQSVELVLGIVKGGKK